MSNPNPSPRHAQHPVAEQFTARWSPRSLSDATVAKAEVMSLLEAARWAPSASNLQPARFVWALRGEAGFAAINAALVPFNQSWASKAAALIVVASKDLVTGRDGVESANVSATFDTGAAWMSMALQAHAMGLVAHAMAGFEAEALATAVNLPLGHTLHAVVAIGHQGPVAALPEGLQAREAPSLRHDLANLSHHGRF